MSRRLEGAWARRIKAWVLIVIGQWVLLICGAVAVDSAMEWPSDPLEAVCEGFLYMLVLHYVGLIFASRLIHTADANLMLFTPMTIARYLRRNLFRIFLPLIVTYLVFPALLVIYWPAELRANALFMANLCLLCIVSLLVGMEEYLGGGSWPLRFFFPGRYLLRFPFWPLVIGLYFTFLAFKYFLPGFPEVFNTWYAAAGSSALTHVVFLVISPLSEVVLVMNTPLAAPILYVMLGWMCVIASIAFWDIWKLLKEDTAEFERRNMEAWIEQRESAEEVWEHEDIELERQIELAGMDLHTPEKDRGIEADSELPFPETAFGAVSKTEQSHQDVAHEGLVYENTPPPETQISRLIDYQAKIPRIVQRVPILKSLVNAPSVKLRLKRAGTFYPLVVLACWVVYLVQSDDSEFLVTTGWVVSVIFYGFTYARPFRLRWVITLGLALPLRWPRLIWRDFVHTVRSRFILDWLAAVVLVLLLQLPLWFCILWWAFFRLSTLSAYLVVVMDFLGKAGRPMPRRLMTIVSFPLRTAQFFAHFIFFVRADEPGAVSLSDLLIGLLIVIGLELFYILLSSAAIGIRFWRKDGTIVGNMKWPAPFVSDDPYGRVYVE